MTARRRSAFTVIELLVAVSILTVIVLILFKLFDQTQRAMRSNAAQTDVTEGARAAMEMLTRELEQAAPMWAGSGDWRRINFKCGPAAGFFPMPLPGGTDRLHYLDQLYFLIPEESDVARKNKQWTATLYCILSRTNAGNDWSRPSYRTNMAPDGVGWLAKRTVVVTNGFGWSLDPLSPPVVGQTLWMDPNRPETESKYGWFQKIADGLVHFRIRPLDSAGQPLAAPRVGPPVLYRDYSTNQVVMTRLPEGGGMQPPDQEPYASTLPQEYVYDFVDSSMPAFVELELGFLDTGALDRFNALPSSQARFRFLTNQANHIHYFQQRIPIRKAPKLLPL